MDWFLMGGMGMYVVTALGLLSGAASFVALVLAIVAWFWRPLRIAAKIVAVLAILASVVPLLGGMAGAAWARSQVDAAIENADPEQREIIRQVGYQEASANSTFGASATCCVLLPAILAIMVALPIPKPAGADEEED